MFKFVSTKNINELFQRAILHNDIQRTKLILEEAMKDPRFNIDQINEEGLTAMQYSCFAGNLEIVKILATYGANWRIRDRDGYTLMHASAMAGNAAVMRYLLQLGLNPTLKTDDAMMPIDVTDEISVIVILLRSMLDQGYLQEMQDYMMDHPKLKRNIFKELEKVKCHEQEREEILSEVPYTTHSLPNPKPVKKTKTRAGAKRSKSTFSELSDSLQQLDRLEPNEYTDLNNNVCDDGSTYVNPYEAGNPYVLPETIEEGESTLKRENSCSSTSSHSSKSSHRSGNAGAGILRNNHELDHSYRNTQQYLESRFPASSRPKSVSFEFDSDLRSNRKYSHSRSIIHYDNRITVRPHRKVSAPQLLPIIGPRAPTSSSPDEPLYENSSSIRMRARLGHAEQPSKFWTHKTGGPPPLPPRAPTTQLSSSYRLSQISSNDKTLEDNYNIPDRLLGSETDSGIDVNETAGRVFALSVNDRRDLNDENSYNVPVLYPVENYSKPIGLYYSEQLKGPLARQHTQDDSVPCNFATHSNYGNPKYRSWNGSSYYEDAPLAPYNSHNRGVLPNELFYDPNSLNNSNNSTSKKVSGSAPNITESNYQSDVNPIVESPNSIIDFSRYDYDNQPEIML